MKNKARLYQMEARWTFQMNKDVLFAYYLHENGCASEYFKIIFSCCLKISASQNFIYSINLNNKVIEALYAHIKHI